MQETAALDGDFSRELYELSEGRIREIAQEEFAEKNFEAFFHECADFIIYMYDVYRQIGEGRLANDDMETLQERNRKLYEKVLPENYESSFLNPAYAVKCMGLEQGRLMSVLYSKVRRMISAAYEQDMEEMNIYIELFLQMYHLYTDEWREEGRLPETKAVRDILYWFSSDYADVLTEKQIRQMVDPDHTFAVDIVMNSDLNDLRYLYAYGEYVTENELRTAQYMNSLPEEKIKLMADTYTEGYRIGFEMTGKDLSKKGSVNIRYQIGFERMIRQAIHNFEEMGLRPVIGQGSFTGAPANRQYAYDHKDDQALVLDKVYVNRLLDVRKTAFEQYKAQAGLFAGPAVLEVFGETPFAPVSKPEACKLSGDQQRLMVEYRAGAMDIQRKYILPEERSFTIIAFPVPEIGDKFEEIFDEIIRINTLDYKLYQGIQQKLIDALDQAAYVEIKGMNGNRTDLQVAMHEMQNPDRETNFENCVADVNIPVGEVFTSPKLTGTNGVLHVSRVFLNELEYKDLAVTFRDGMIEDYICANFDTEEENRNYIKENVLYNQETLPLGEFAIGTNTTAYVVAQKYDIGAKLPILIAEKMGPHFAVGDTCYSHEEEIATFNPDGKQIVARENEVSALRKTDPSKAYFNCHTDITIPYDELGLLTAVRKDGSRVVIIENGRFVLPGCEELNKPFAE